MLDTSPRPQTGRPASRRPAAEPRTSRNPAGSTANVSPAATSSNIRPEPARRRPAATLEPGQGTRAPVEEPSAGISESGRPRTARGFSRRPLIVLACVGVFALGALAFRNWRQHRETLPQVVRLGQTEGIAALEEGKFDYAHQLLSEAKEAVDALGGEVEGSEEVRHAADEAAIFVNLLTDSLESLLDEAAMTSPQTWADRFDARYKGRSVIIDATITATPESGKSNRYELDYLVLAAGQGARDARYARIDLTGFEAVALAGHKPGDSVIFGARLAGFQYDAEAKEWLIRFEPRSGVSMTHYKALQTMGWPSGLSVPDDRSGGPDQP